MQFTRACFSASFCCFFLLSSCGPSDLETETGLTRAATPATEATGGAAPLTRGREALRFGRVPYGPYGDMYRDHQSLLAHLTKHLGEPFDLQLFADYGDMVRAIKNGDLELAWLGPLAYLDAEDALANHPRFRLKPIVKPKRHGNTYYASEIIVRKDSGMESVKDLAGKRMAFVDTQSTAGYLLAAAYLVKSGISVGDPVLKERHFVNQYGNVVLSVLFGRFDAGAVFEGAPAVFLKGREKDRRGELRVLTRSDSVPYEPIAAVVGARITADRARQIQRLFLDLNPTDHGEILNKIQAQGFVTAEAAEYAPIRQIAKIVENIQSGDRHAGPKP